MTTEAEFVSMQLAHILPSPTNPRRKFDDVKLAELAESIKAKGVLQPVLLRPHPNGRAGPQRFELVAGERRVRAAKLAGLAEIPAVVRRLSDRDVLEAQVVENEQRADVTAMEKADGYARLIDEHQVSIEDLAARVGKSVSTIRGLLKLRALPDVAREALELGVLPPATAELIARVPNEKVREEVACRVLCNHGYGTPATLKDARRVLSGGEMNDDVDVEPMSFRAAREMIGRLYMVELKGAPFDRASLDLVPTAGSCDACQKRTGNCPDDYPGARADVCTDPACYREKVQAHNANLLAEAKASGRKVLTAKEVKDVFDSYPPHRLAYNVPWVDLAQPCHEVSGGKIWKKLVGKQIADQVVIGVDPAGAPHELVPKAAALKVLRKDHGSNARSASSNGHDASWKRQQAQHRADELLQKEVGRRCMGIAAEAAEQMVMQAFATPGVGIGLQPMLRHLVAGVVERAWDEVSRQVKNRRGLGAERNGHGTGNRDAVADLVDHMTSPELLGLLAELIVGQHAFQGFYAGGEKKVRTMFEFFGIDRKAIENEVRAEAKAGKKPGKPKAKANAATPHVNGQASNSPVAVAGACRVCGCTEQDCRGCVERTGDPCEWTSPKKDLCTACLPLLETDFGVLFTGYAPPGHRVRISQLSAAGIRTIGQCLGLGETIALPEKVTAQYAAEIRQLAHDWLRKQLKLASHGDGSVSASGDGLRITKRDTFLIDLIQGGDVAKFGRALEAAKLHTVGDLLTAAADTPGPAQQRHYTFLKRVKGLSAQAAHEIGDAMIDAGLVVEDDANE